MDFYSSLKELLEQIPKGRVTRLTDIADALGDRKATIALPLALEKLFPRCRSAAKVVKADDSVVLKEAVAILRDEGLDVRRHRVVDVEGCLYNRFERRPILAELRSLQQSTARQVVLRDAVKELKKLVGLDLAYKDDEAVVAAVIMDADTFDIEKEVAIKIDINFPYIPGYLAFRELPAMIKILRKIGVRPDILFVDGHGILHPAGCGIATHVGVKTNLPTIGVAKSLLVGKVLSPSLQMGEVSPVRMKGKVKGYAFRSSQSKHPIYISPGNWITPVTALNVTRNACKHRIPEPLRQSHILAEKMKNK